MQGSEVGSPFTDRLFEVPRIEVVLDEANPDTIRIAFAGTVELDRGNRQQVELYNDLVAGTDEDVAVTVHVEGARKLHHRDSEGAVDGIVETKALRVVEIYGVQR